MGNISNWTEGILLVLAFVIVLGIVVGSFNYLYDKSYDVGLSDNSTEQKFIEYETSSESQIKGGEVAFDAQQGISLKSSYGLAVDAIDIIWSFLSGGFIENVAEMLNLGESAMVLARILRILWFLSLVFALLYALFKVVM